MNTSITGLCVLVAFSLGTINSAFGEEPGAIPSEWRSLDESGLVDVSKQMYAQGESAREQRETLKQYIRNDLMVDVNATRRISIDGWHRLLFSVHKELTAEERMACAKMLTNTYASTAEELISNAPSDALKLAEARAYILKDDGGGLMLADYVDNSDQWKELNLSDIGRVLVILFKHKTETVDVRRKVALHLRDNYHIEDGKTYSFRECVSLVRAAMDVRDNGLARRWVQKAYDVAVGTEAARGAVTPKIISELAFLREWTKATVKTPYSPAFSDAIVRMAINGDITDTTPDWECMWFGKALSSSEEREAVSAQLQDASGAVSMGIGKTLASAYAYAGERGKWEAFTASKAADESCGGDERAKWMLLRAFIDCLKGGDVQPCYGMEWRMSALGMAETTSLRLEILNEIAEGHAFMGRHAEGIAVLDSLEGQFEAEGAGGEVQSLRNEMKRAMAEYRAGRREWKSKRRARNQAIRTRNLRRRLVNAQLKGRVDQAAEVSRVLQGVSATR